MYTLLRRLASRNASRQFSSSHPPSPPRTRSLGLATTSAIVAVASTTAYTLGSIYPPSTLSFLFPRPAPGPPTDPTSPSSIAYTQSLEARLQSLPLLQSHRNKSDAEEWYEVRPYANFPEERRVNSLTSGALRGPGKLALHPLVRARKDETESLVVVHVGRGLCGHDGIVHGGLLATVLDETLARLAISNLPDKVGVTAQLTVNYRAPTRADQFIVIRTFLKEKNGRKVTVTGSVESLDGTRLAEATALFVQPKYAKLLNTEALKKAMGEPPAPDSGTSAAPVHLADGVGSTTTTAAAVASGVATERVS